MLHQVSTIVSLDRDAISNLQPPLLSSRVSRCCARYHARIREFEHSRSVMVQEMADCVKLRPMNCEINLLSRSDGSTMFMQGTQIIPAMCRIAMQCVYYILFLVSMHRRQRDHRRCKRTDRSEEPKDAVRQNFHRGHLHARQGTVQ